MTTENDLGKLDRLTIWTDNKGKSPDWMLSKVIVVDISTNERYKLFIRTFKYLINRGNHLMRYELKNNKIMHYACKLWSVNLFYANENLTNTESIDKMLISTLMTRNRLNTDVE